VLEQFLTQKSKRMKIAILGGGLTGLTLANFMRQKGLDFDVLEKEKECGGLMRTLRTKEFTFDYGGSHIIFSRNTKTLKFMLGLLGENKVKRRRNTKVLYKGRFVKYPFENGLADLPKEENFECLYHFIQNLIKKATGDVERPRNLREWCFYTFGKGIAEKYLIPYNEKIWKYPPKKMGLEWVERIPSPPVEDVIRSSLGIATEGYTHQLYFYYPTNGGIHALIKSLEQKIERRIKTLFEVKEISKEGDSWIISNGRKKKSYHKIISTIPVQELTKAVNAPRRVQDAAHNLKCNSIITVMIGLDRKRINRLSWLYIPDRESLAHRVSFPSNFSPNVVPKGKSSLLAEITCSVGDKTWNAKDKEIINATVNDLHRMKIIHKADVCFADVRRTEFAYVINDLGYSKNIKIVRDYFRRIGIDLVGRFAEFKYLNMDDCIKSASNYLHVGFGKQKIA
jgi:protoporphyrinogen oxidase